MNSTRSAAVCLWFTLTIFVAFMTFVMKNCVEDLEKELVQINSKINDDVRADSMARKMLARQNLNNQAVANKELRKMAKAQR